MRNKILAIDMDGTICDQNPALLAGVSKVKPDAVKTINKLYDVGYIIHIYSGRHSQMWEPTVKWLEENGVKYHWLVLGKTFADYYIDDRAIKFEDNWEEIKKNLLNEIKREENHVTVRRIDEKIQK